MKNNCGGLIYLFINFTKRPGSLSKQQPVAKMLRHSRKNNLSCFKSLLVTGPWDKILTSLLPPIQSCSSKFWAWSCIASNFEKGWTGGHKCKIMDRPFKPNYGSVSQVLLQLVEAPLWGPEKKINKTTNKNDNTLETTKKMKQKCKNRIGEDIDKNQQHIWSSKVFNGRLVWHLIHTLKGLGGVNIINRLSEIQVVIKKIFLKVCYWKVSVLDVCW